MNRQLKGVSAEGVTIVLDSPVSSPRRATAKEFIAAGSHLNTRHKSGPATDDPSDGEVDVCKMFVKHFACRPTVASPPVHFVKQFT